MDEAALHLSCVCISDDASRIMGWGWKDAHQGWVCHCSSLFYCRCCYFLATLNLAMSKDPDP